MEEKQNISNLNRIDKLFSHNILVVKNEDTIFFEETIDKIPILKFSCIFLNYYY